MNVNNSPEILARSGGIKQPDPRMVETLSSGGIKQPDPLVAEELSSGGIKQPDPLSTGDAIATLSSEAIEASNKAV